MGGVPRRRWKRDRREEGTFWNEGATPRVSCSNFPNFPRCFDHMLIALCTEIGKLEQGIDYVRAFVFEPIVLLL